MRHNLKLALITILSLALCGNVNCNDDWTFPKDLFIGAASSAYQVEGGWNASDKGVSYWDWLTHTKPWKIDDGSNGDIACDSFHKYKEDIEMLKDIGFDFYRLSISWTRIFPTGFANKISNDGIQYYKDLIDELRSKGLEPFVTIFHIDYPLIFEEFGTWTNERLVDWFTDFARFVFQELGPKVKYFVTINSINVICRSESKILYSQYLCVHTLLKAHARIYHMYNNEFRPTQNGKIGIVVQCKHFFGENANDTLTSDIAFQYDCGCAAHPIFSKNGNYPKVMRDRIDENSKIQGWPRSRLPKFTQTEIEYIRGTADYFALNHYTANIAIPVKKQGDKGWINDQGYNLTVDPKWPESAHPMYRVVPSGFREILRKIRNEYDNPAIYVLENGFADRGGLTDFDRLNYYYSYLKEMLLAIKDGCDVKAYTVWSLMDNFEWNFGYSIRYGIVSVNFNDPARQRTYKRSAMWFKDVLRTRKLIPIKHYMSKNKHLKNLI